MKVTLGGLVVVLVGVGCGDDEVTVDASVQSDAAAVVTDAPPDASTRCHDLTQLGAQIELVALAEDPPSPTGGTIPTGIYTKIAMNEYTGPGGESGGRGVFEAETGRYNGDGTVDILQDDVAFTQSYVTDGSGGIQFTDVCYDVGGSAFDGYSVLDATTLMLINSEGISYTLEFQ